LIVPTTGHDPGQQAIEHFDKKAKKQPEKGDF
jgi:hypothetical protein